VSFTLLTQSAIGLVWVRVLGRWFGAGEQAAVLTFPMLLALILTGLGLCAALAHLAKPRLASHALRNIAASWLSREVLLVQVFAGTVALTILLELLDITSGLVIMEAAACLLGGAALFAMTQAYLLKTVPVWNSPATPLEFAGSALLLGGALGVVLTTFTATERPGLSPAMVAAGIAILAGLLLELAAISAAVTAEQATQGQTWYEPPRPRGLGRHGRKWSGLAVVRFGFGLPGRRRGAGAVAFLFGL
jgi:anaerobic dimethyl sulfoxide reductase subunit C (anchor subunit)